MASAALMWTSKGRPSSTPAFSAAFGKITGLVKIPPANAARIRKMTRTTFIAWPPAGQLQGIGVRAQGEALELPGAAFILDVDLDGDLPRLLEVPPELRRRAGVWA